MIFDVKSKDFLSRPLLKRENPLKKTGQSETFTPFIHVTEEQPDQDDVSAFSSIPTTMAMDYLAVLSAKNYSSDKQGIAYGSDMLTALDTLKNQIIEGRVTKKTLEPLQILLKKTDIEALDPQLRLLIEDIRIRVEVELAKWDQIL